MRHVRECPQDAKQVRGDLARVKSVVASDRRVVASVAPSAPAFFDMLCFSQMEEALARLGVHAAGETAFGAEMVGQAHGDLVNREPDRWPILASSCPVVVNLVEMYYPDLIAHLSPIVSPMIAHGRFLRQVYGEGIFVVFIGPCVAKKGEIDIPGVAGVIDAALTFPELKEWLADAGVAFPMPEWETDDSSTTTESSEDVHARLFPVEGGLVGTADMDTDMLSSHVLTGSGIEACMNVLEGVRSGALEACLVELMACPGGCINGPVLADLSSIALSRQRVMQYAARRQPQPLPTRAEWPDLGRGYSDRSVSGTEFTEEQLTQALHRVNKYSPEDELNCGACGYDSCREKAVATLCGMAEATMCIPYMRSRAESLTNVVMDVTPNPIVIVDKALHIQGMSHSAEETFGVNVMAARGKSLRAIVPVGGENLMVAIMRDVTESVRAREMSTHIRAETLARSQEVISKQMRVAHEIASLLGETTAETKVLLTQLGRLMEESNDDSPTG